MQLLPNVLYSNGDQWALFRYGQLVGRVARRADGVARAGSQLTPHDDEFARVVTDFLTWMPDKPRTVNQLGRAIVGLCRLLRSEVADALVRERSGKVAGLHFTGGASDWRTLIFPELSDEDFANACAQTATFALLLAHVHGIDFEGKQLREVAAALTERHSLMGRALAVLSEEAIEQSVAVTPLLQVIGAVNEDQLTNGDTDTYLRLADHLLGAEDQGRARAGSYYTPNEIASFMVRFVDNVLRQKMGKSSGLASDDVIIADPAMGTGTFLLSIIERVTDAVVKEDGQAAAQPQLRALLGRLIGFEKQIGPYAAAELRIHRALAEYGTELSDDARIYLADALDSPHSEQLPLSPTLDPFARSRHAATSVIRDQPVSVVVGNPPYRTRAKGMGGWIEHGDISSGLDAPIQQFRTEGNGLLEHVLSDAYVYFWRWATWKVFDDHPEQPGIVAFITPSSYATGQGYAGMREYLRRTADEGWIIDLSPEGARPDVSTRIFPGVQAALCIGVFVCYGPAAPDRPARIHHVSINGTRTEKLGRLGDLQLDDLDWADCGTGWQDRLTPAEDEAWKAFPLLVDLFPWHANGVQPNRTWVYAPDADTLRHRWDQLISAQPEEKPTLFRESRSRSVGSVSAGLPGFRGPERTIRDEAGACPAPVRIGYRSFDRQWIIPDSRLLYRSRPDLWRVRGSRQIYTVLQHAQPLAIGPGAVFCA